MLPQSRSVEMLTCSVPSFESSRTPRRAAPVPPISIPLKSKRIQDGGPSCSGLGKQSQFIPRPAICCQPTPVTKRLLKSRSADSPLVPQSQIKNSLSPCISLQSLSSSRRDQDHHHEMINPRGSSRDGRESPRPLFPSAVQMYRSASAHRLHETNVLQVIKPRTRHISLDDRLQQVKGQERNSAVYQEMDKLKVQIARLPQKKTQHLPFPPIIRLQGCNNVSDNVEPQHLRPPTVKERARSYSGPSCSAPSDSRMAPGNNPPGMKLSEFRSQTPPPITTRISQRKFSAPQIQVMCVPKAQAQNQPITTQPESSSGSKVSLPPINPKPKRRSLICASPVNATTPNTKTTAEIKDVIRLQPVILDIQFGKIILEPEEQFERKPENEHLRKIERPIKRGSGTNAQCKNGNSENIKQEKERQDKNISKRKVVIRDTKEDREDEGCCHGCVKDCMGDLPECLLEYVCCNC
ncbi:uncharacterized protein LOC119731712 [Patiria miniata]|uniref:Uncharacterized protein n=1 Tax=Patiria miniata TaxID=46514 RepID=A0A914ABZ2_PATMI|nr:uncharacterized protein LOC119731712 [Patiria miniata]